MNLLSLLELAGLITALLYLLLVTEQRRSCWIYYITSSILYIPVFWQAHLYADATLQLYFVFMGFYAAITWNPLAAETIQISKIGSKASSKIALFIILAGLSLGFVLSSTPAGKFAYADSLICIGSIVTTLLTARKVLECWYFWIVINLLATLTFAMKELNFTVVLYGIFFLLSIRALGKWRADYTSTMIDIESPSK